MIASRALIKLTTEDGNETKTSKNRKVIILKMKQLQIFQTIFVFNFSTLQIKNLAPSIFNFRNYHKYCLVLSIK